MKHISILLVATLATFACGKKAEDQGKAPTATASEPKKEEAKSADSTSETVAQAASAAIVGNDAVTEEKPVLPETQEPLGSREEKIDLIVKLLFINFDVDSSGAISQEEFLKGLRKHFLSRADDERRLHYYEIHFRRHYQRILSLFLKYAGDDKEISPDELKQLIKDHPRLLRILLARKIIIPALKLPEEPREAEEKKEEPAR